MPRKKGEPRVTKYVTDAEMKNHFTQHVNKCVEIIDRQLKKIGKTARGRSFIYTQEQVNKLNEYLLSEIEKTVDRLNRKVASKENFNIGV